MGRNRSHEVEIAETTDRAHKQTNAAKQKLNFTKGREEAEQNPSYWKNTNTLTKLRKTSLSG